MIEELIPTQLKMKRVRQVVIELMNLVGKALSGKLSERDAVIQQLRDELNRIKANRANPRSKGRNRVRISPPNKNALVEDRRPRPRPAIPADECRKGPFERQHLATKPFLERLIVNHGKKSIYASLLKL